MNEVEQANAGASIPSGVFDVATPATPEGRKAVRRVAGPSTASTPLRWAIMLDESQGSVEAQDVGIGVNGRWYVYKRGAPIECPPEVLEALDHAIYYRAVAVVDERTGLPNGLGEPKKIRRYPYQKFYITINEFGERVRELPVITGE